MLKSVLLFSIIMTVLGRRSPGNGARRLKPTQSPLLVHQNKHPRPNTGIPGIFGVDVDSQTAKATSQDLWACMQVKGNYSFAVLEAWQGGFGMTEDLAKALENAWGAGFHNVDLYAFMCPNCKDNGVEGVELLINYLKTNGAKYGRIWMDVEQCDGCWSVNLTANCVWIKELAQKYLDLGTTLGVYASMMSWETVVGVDCTAFGDLLPLWYPLYDDQWNFKDFTPFAGWKTPARKQFSDIASKDLSLSVSLLCSDFKVFLFSG